MEFVAIVYLNQMLAAVHIVNIGNCLSVVEIGKLMCYRDSSTKSHAL